jgi:hypothetical protein
MSTDDTAFTQPNGVTTADPVPEVAPTPVSYAKASGIENVLIWLFLGLAAVAVVGFAFLYFSGLAAVAAG